MRISLMFFLAGLFAFVPGKRNGSGGKWRLLNVEDAVRLYSGDDAIF